MGEIQLGSHRGRCYSHVRPHAWFFLLYICLRILTCYSSTMTDFTWREWRSKETSLVEADANAASSSTDTSSPNPDGEGWVLRPVWQRAGLCLGHIILGASLAAIIWTGRTRIVQRLHLFQSPTGQREIFVQSGAHTGNQGFLVPLSSAELSPGRDATEATLKVNGLRGKFLVECNGSSANGEELSGVQVRDTILDAWGIKRSAPSTAKDPSWTSGPIVGKP